MVFFIIDFSLVHIAVVSRIIDTQNMIAVKKPADSLSFNRGDYFH